MKCPVCNSDCETHQSCPVCGFNQINVEFINKDDAENWMREVVLPYREAYCHKDLFIIREAGYREYIEKIGRYGKYQETTLYCPVKTLVGLNKRDAYPKIINIPDDVEEIRSFGFPITYTHFDNKEKQDWCGKIVLPSALKTLKARALMSSNAQVLDFSRVVSPALIISEFACNIQTLQKIIFPETIVSIEKCAFQGCSMLDHFSIKNCGTIHDSAFLSCTSLRYVVLNDVGEIKRNAFNNCPSLRHIFLGRRIADASVNGEQFMSVTKVHPQWLGNSRPQIHQPGEWQIVDNKIKINK